MRDINSEVAGWLRDLAFVQKSTQSRWGYKRAASAVMSLPVPIDTLLNPDGTLQKISNIGPASTRVILEVLQGGASALAHARLAGIPRDRIINCWPLARLLGPINVRAPPDPRAELSTPPRPTALRYGRPPRPQESCVTCVTSLLLSS